MLQLCCTFQNSLMIKLGNNKTQNLLAINFTKMDHF